MMSPKDPFSWHLIKDIKQVITDPQMMNKKYEPLYLANLYMPQSVNQLDARAEIHKEENQLSQLIKEFANVFHAISVEPEHTKKFFLHPDECMMVNVDKPVVQKKNLGGNFASSSGHHQRKVYSSPFYKSGLASNSEDKVWFYRDAEKNIQGPFSTREMDNWYDQNLFPHTLDIAFKEASNFKKLYAFLEENDLSKKLEITSETHKNISGPPGQLSGKKLESKEESQHHTEHINTKPLIFGQAASETVSSAPKRLGFVNKKKEVAHTELQPAATSKLPEEKPAVEEPKKINSDPVVIKEENQQKNAAKSGLPAQEMKQEPAKTIENNEDEEDAEEENDGKSGEDKKKKKKKKRKSQKQIPEVSNTIGSEKPKTEAQTEAKTNSNLPEQSSKKTEGVKKSEPSKAENKKIQLEEAKADTKNDLAKKEDPKKVTDKKETAQKVEEITAEKPTKDRLTEAREKIAEVKAKIESHTEDTGFIVTMKKSKKGKKMEILNAFPLKEQESKGEVKTKSLIDEVDEIVKKDKNSKLTQPDKMYKPSENEFPDLIDTSKEVKQVPSLQKESSQKGKKMKTEKYVVPQNTEKPKPVNMKWDEGEESPASGRNDPKKAGFRAEEDSFPDLKNSNLSVPTMPIKKESKTKISGSGNWEPEKKKTEKPKNKLDFDKEFPSL